MPGPAIRGSALAEWRNWQTRRIQNPVSARVCRFESGLGYQGRPARSPGRVGPVSVSVAVPAPVLRGCVTGGRLATGVLAIGARSAVSLRLRTSSLPPNRCAAHPEPSSSVRAEASAVTLPLRVTPPYGGKRANAMWGGVDVANDNRQASNHLRLA